MLAATARALATARARGAAAGSAAAGLALAAAHSLTTASTAAAPASSSSAPGSSSSSTASPFALAPIKCSDGTAVTPFSLPSRAEQLARLENEVFDVVVVGGGCVGAGCAWEAATRGLKVALVERDDFSSGTSGRSTKLIHGGIRYLEAAFKNLDREMLHLVSEALAERAHLLNAAPYMAHPLATLLPIYTWWEVPYMWAGCKLYDLIAGARRAVPASYYVSAEEARFQFPMLKADGLKGGIVYYDGQQNDTRMNLMIALTATQAGAAIANYVGVTAVAKDAGGRAAGVEVRDELTGRKFSVRARGVINATGCFGDAVRKLDDPAAEGLILGAAGVHVVLPDHFSPDNMGLIIPKTSDGRVLFFLPWEGSTLCGTTDAPCEISMTPRATEEDVRFILEESNRYLTTKIRPEDVKAAWSGIRPLIRDPRRLKEGATSAQLSRSHVVDVSASGLVSILGGKWTTYRKMAEEAVDALAAACAPAGAPAAAAARAAGGHAAHAAAATAGKPPHALGPLPRVAPSATLTMQLMGADRAGIVINRKYDRIPVTLRNEYGLAKDVAKHLTLNYGTRALQVAELVRRRPELGRSLSPLYPFLAAEVVFACEQEYAESAVDVLARRTRLAYLDVAAARAAVPEVVALMAASKGWARARREAEQKGAFAFIETMHAPPPAPKAAAA
jgi:glycerol-3-phosphate dehydrogenase